ncbi:antirestriction protein [Aquimarina sp. MAR_2010_214]|uniref:antirestriction protein n=1 Tax=Aquimarina sp. MAR_2010_214 TaxID=1250026 RepID=UPI000C70D6C1|nr:antirestriction protein [Aquimarina sp. MAR_2010_214]PKV50884.1 antirestriction protein [Aquimarina sp. MAR_2010_214]
MAAAEIIEKFEGNDHLKRTLCPDNEEMEFLYQRFGKHSMYFEGRVYRYLRAYCSSYNGGHWLVYTLSNGGFYMSLRHDKMLDIEQPSNFYQGKMSPDAASIGVNLYALGDIANKLEIEAHIDAYHHLRDYAKIHPESAEIFRFID